jgi:hypothetical protein
MNTHTRIMFHLQAVNDCGVVYDGRLVVDHNFTATDPSILGSGSVAKFSRRYRAPLPMQQYASRETGKSVAISLLQRLLPGVDASAVSPAAVSRDLASAVAPSALIPTFRKPKVTVALLPGALHYLHARLPVFDLGSTGRELVTCVPALESGAVPASYT